MSWCHHGGGNSTMTLSIIPTSLFGEVASRADSTKSLPEPMLTYCQLNLRNKLQWNLNQNMHSRNAYWNVICKMVPILFSSHWMKFMWTSLAETSVKSCCHYKPWWLWRYLQVPRCPPHMTHSQMTLSILRGSRMSSKCCPHCNDLRRSPYVVVMASSTSCSVNPRYVSMAWCKTAVTPLLMRWSYCSLALSHRYVNIWSHFVKEWITITVSQFTIYLYYF